ncbi:MAG: hypothetical protein AMXMBFR84_01000 [Candidatus Hydrogenedentota bacterium]
MSSEDLDMRFAQAAEDVTKLPEAPDNTIMLQLYGLFKQATKGDCDGKRPGILDLIGRAKYDSWAENKGTPQETAKEKYIALVAELKSNVGK